MSKPHVHTLKNGIPVVSVAHMDAPSVTLMVFVKVGSRYEARETNGASHFIEHLMFKGTKRRPTAMDVSQTLDRFGAEFNAFTGKDLTAYYIKIDAAQLPLAIDLLHDMLFHSQFDAKELERERGVIVEEINMYEDNPRMHIDDLLEEALFPNNTLGWTITGPRKTIQEMPRKAIMDYHARYYIPSRLTIALAGRIAPNAQALLEKTFGKILEPKASQDVSFEPFAPPAKLKQPITFQSKQTEQVQLGMAFYGIPHDDKQRPAMSLLSTILGGSMSSRLFNEVREKRGLCYSISASHHALEDTGLFSIMAGLERRRVKEAIRVIWKELKQMATKPVGAKELQHAKDHIRGKLRLAFEDSSSQADWYGKQWVFRRTLETPEDRLAAIERVTAKQIRDLAKQTFNAKTMAAALIGPFRGQSEVSSLFL